METAIRGDTLLKLGRVLFSGIAFLEAILILAVVWFSLQFNTDEDILRENTDFDAPTLLASGGMVVIAIIFALGGIAVWNKSLPGRRVLLGTTIVGLLVVYFLRFLSVLGIADIYLD
jgi:hypothetical protein